jgi:hypothetical protein
MGQAGHPTEENHAEDNRGAEQQPGGHLAIVAGLISEFHELQPLQRERNDSEYHPRSNRAGIQPGVQWCAVRTLR